jgi:hypothetical protein
MRGTNYRSLDSVDGLKNFAKQTRAMFVCHRTTLEADLRQLVLQALR